MKIADIKWNSDPGSFIKPSDYESFSSTISKITKSGEDVESSIYSQLNNGGLSAESLNINGTSPLFELGYATLENIRTSCIDVESVQSQINSDGETHMQCEWAKYYEESLIHLDELYEEYEKALASYNAVVDEYNSAPTSDAQSALISKLSAANQVKEDALKAYEEYAKKVEEIGSHLSSIASPEIAKEIKGIVEDGGTVFGNNALTNNNVIDFENGKIIDIPQNFTQTGYTVTGYDYWINSGNEMVWSSGTNQRAVSDIWKSQGSRFKNGIAVITIDGVDRYLIATASSLGNTGDMVNVKLANGQVIPAIIADAKSSGDSNYTTYGHANGSGVNVLEFEVQREKFLQSGNPKTSSYGLEWDSSSPVVQVQNGGSILNQDINSITTTKKTTSTSLANLVNGYKSTNNNNNKVVKNTTSKTTNQNIQSQLDSTLQSLNRNYTNDCPRVVTDSLIHQGVISNNDGDKLYVSGRNLASDMYNLYKNNSNYNVTNTSVQTNISQSQRGAIFKDFVQNNGNENIVLSFNNGWGNAGAVHGHTMMVSKVENGKVYFIDNANYQTSINQKNGAYEYVYNIDEFLNLPYFDDTRQLSSMTIINKK